MIAVLCGGVGAARFLVALAQVAEPSDTVGIVNTGDDTVLHGLVISPDLDTVTYTLADAIDGGRGWGLADESWRAMEALRRYASVTPEGSAAAPTWFNLGDHDLATHFYRTARLREGATLTEVTAEICAAWGVDAAARADERSGGRHGRDTRRRRRRVVPGVLRQVAPQRAGAAACASRASSGAQLTPGVERRR